MAVTLYACNGIDPLRTLQAIPTLLFWEVRRKDFLESLAHHVATLILIVYSYYIK
jgi:TLC domain